MMRRHDEISAQRLAIGLMILGILARLVPHPWNATPLTAIALLGTTYLGSRWAVLLPVGILMVSDLFLGLHELVPFTWGSMALTALLGWWVRRQPTPSRIMSASLAGSTLFFLVTNLGVWLFADGGTMYLKTWAGLWRCYLAAVPFYRSALAGDLMYTAVLFSLYALATRHVLEVAARSSSSRS